MALPDSDTINFVAARFFPFLRQLQIAVQNSKGPVRLSADNVAGDDVVVRVNAH